MTRHFLPSLTIGITAICIALGCGGAPGAGASGPGATGSDGSGDEPGNKRAAAPIPPPKVGTQAAEERFVSLDFELTLSKDGSAAGLQSGKWSLDEQRSYEILDVQGSAVKKFRVAFGRRKAQALLGVEPHAATAGKTYILEASGGGLNVTDKAGDDITADERDGVREYDWVGTNAPLLVWLDAGKLPAGQRRAADPEQASALIGHLPGVDHQKTKLSVESKGPSDGARPGLDLAVTAKLVLTSGKTVLTLDLSGTAQIDLETGWVADLSLKGPIGASGTVASKKGPLGVKGRGTAELRRHTEF